MACMIMQRFDIDLAIIDIMMPRMNGYELHKSFCDKPAKDKSMYLRIFVQGIELTFVLSKNKVE